MISIYKLISKDNSIYDNRAIKTSLAGLQNRIGMSKGAVDEFFYEIYFIKENEYLIKCEYTTLKSYVVYTKYFTYNSTTDKVKIKQSIDFPSISQEDIKTILTLLKEDTGLLITDRRFMDTKTFQQRVYNLYITENEVTSNRRSEKYIVKCIPLDLSPRLKEENNGLRNKIITWSERDLVETLCNIHLYNNENLYSYKIIN